MTIKFKDINHRIEELYESGDFENYIETVLHYIEYETDHDYKSVVSKLNKKIKDHISLEAKQNDLIKHDKTVSLL